MGLTSKLIISAVADQSNALDLTAVTANLNYTKAVSLASGVLAGQADRIFHDQRTLIASATEDLDLAGVLLDIAGAAITFQRIKGLIVAAAAGNTNNVVFGAAAANPWTALLGATGTLVLRPGAVMGMAAGAADAIGYAVAAGTGDMLKVANSAGGSPVTYDIILLGASA